MLRWHFYRILLLSYLNMYFMDYNVLVYSSFLVSLHGDYSTGPLIRNTYFEQDLKPYCRRGCKRNFLIHHFLLLQPRMLHLLLISPVSCFQRSSFLLLITAVIAFFFSILWSLSFSRRIFVASTTAPVSPRLCDTCSVVPGTVQ